MTTKEPRTLTTTVKALEDFWGHDRDEWGLMGPPASDEEVIRFRYDDLTGPAGYVLERLDPDATSLDGPWYVAIDGGRYDAADLPLPAFRIENRHSGHVLGEYPGIDEAHALDEMYRDAGYADADDAIKQVGADPSSLIVTKVDKG